MAYMKEKKEHKFILDLLKKHFNEDEAEEAMREMYESEGEDDDYYEDASEEMEGEEEESYPENEMMEGEEEEDEEEEMELPKDKRKGLAVVIIQKRMSKPKKDMY